jgi:hypothetical protein
MQSLQTQAIHLLMTFSPRKTCTHLHSTRLQGGLTVRSVCVWWGAATGRTVSIRPVSSNWRQNCTCMGALSHCSSELSATGGGRVSFANVSAVPAVRFSAGYKILALLGRWISQGPLRNLRWYAPLLLPLSKDAQSIFACKCSPCLEIVNTTSEFTYHWVGLSQILSENAVVRSRQTCLHENQEHRAPYPPHPLTSSPFSWTASWRMLPHRQHTCSWSPVTDASETNAVNLNFERLPSKAHIS